MTSTVVPNRNAIFISILYGWAISLANEYENGIIVSLGVHSGDHAIYPDCRIEFYEKIISAFETGNWNSDSVSLYLPYINYDKSKILKDALNSADSLNLDFDIVFRNTVTSYNPDINGISNGKSGSDIERILAFDKIGRKDPLQYKYRWNEVLNFARKTEDEFMEKKNQ